MWTSTRVAAQNRDQQSVNRDRSHAETIEHARPNRWPNSDDGGPVIIDLDDFRDQLPVNDPRLSGDWRTNFLSASKLNKSKPGGLIAAGAF